MVSAVVLLKIERNQINRVAEQLADLDGISGIGQKKREAYGAEVLRVSLQNS